MQIEDGNPENIKNKKEYLKHGIKKALEEEGNGKENWDSEQGKNT